MKYNELYKSSPDYLKYIINELAFVRDEIFYPTISVTKTIENFVNRANKLTNNIEYIITFYLFFIGKHNAKKIDENGIVTFDKFNEYTKSIIRRNDYSGYQIRQFIHSYKLSVRKIINNIDFLYNYYISDFLILQNAVKSNYFKNKKYNSYQKELLYIFSYSLNMYLDIEDTQYFSNISLGYIKNELLSKKREFKKNLFIFRGISGSGKTTSCELLCDVSIGDDMFFEQNGNYTRFTKYYKKVSSEWAYSLVENAMKNNVPKIGINNMFLKYKSIEPYIELAKKYKYNVFQFIVENINNTKNIHGISNEGIEKYKKQIEIKI